ncbi:MAG: DUF4276 family protein [Elusimicrobiota bacterium]
MKRVLILVEGQTEEKFVNDVLIPGFSQKGLYCIPVLATTKRVKIGSDFKGGIVSYQKTKNDILRLLQDTNAIVVTTMIDYYGFSSLVPFRASIKGINCFERVMSLEALFKNDINHDKFLPYLQLHEFEAMVFVSPKEAAEALTEVRKVADVEKVKQQFHSPEEINDNPTTTPSKRLENIFHSYEKPLHGPLITKRIGLDNIRKECKHFNDWCTTLENL